MSVALSADPRKQQLWMKTPCGSIVDRLRGCPEFVAGRLPHSEHDLAVTLHIDRATALRIMICRTPGPASWVADIHRIADRFALRDADLDALLTAWTPPGGQ